MNENAIQLVSQGTSEKDALHEAITEFYTTRALTLLKDTAFQAAVFSGSVEVFNGISNLITIKVASPEANLPNTS